MKTISVVFTHKKLSFNDLLSKKSYHFNYDHDEDSEDLVIGSVIMPERYNNYLQVVNIYDRCYGYYNTLDSSLSNDQINDDYRPIALLEGIIVSDDHMYDYEDKL